MATAFPNAHDPWAGILPPTEGEGSSRLKYDYSTYFLALIIPVICRDSGAQRFTGTHSHPD